MITQLETNPCETIYDVDGNTLRLWIITGGTPALSFSDFSFDERYPKVEKWSDKKWIKTKSRYIHQDPTNIQGPTFDVLPNGEKSLYEFLEKHLPLRNLRQKRLNELPVSGVLVSQRFHDIDNNCYFRCDLDTRRGVCPVTVSSSIYSGRCENTVQKFASEWWKNASKLFNPIFDSGKYQYEELSEEIYQSIKNYLTFFPK